MANEQLKPLIQQGLNASSAGLKVSAEGADEVQNDATNPQLKQLLEQGVEMSKQWQARVEQAQQELGGAEKQSNPIMEAHHEVSKKIRRQAPDAHSRDLGIIANGQLVLHYWMANFGTLSAYATQAGLNETAQLMQTCTQEAQQADEQHTQLAQQLMGAA